MLGACSWSMAAMCPRLACWNAALRSVVQIAHSGCCARASWSVLMAVPLPSGESPYWPACSSMRTRRGRCARSSVRPATRRRVSGMAMGRMPPLGLSNACSVAASRRPCGCSAVSASSGRQWPPSTAAAASHTRAWTVASPRTPPLKNTLLRNSYRSPEGPGATPRFVWRSTVARDSRDTGSWFAGGGGARKRARAMS